jgi:methylenetetrahydrofolate reductase (NADPH)
MVTREKIKQVLSGYSVEVTPVSASKVERFTDHVPLGTVINVTFLPGSDIEDTIAVCARIRDEGFKPVPHIAARSLESRDHLVRYLDGLASRASVNEALVIGGGVDHSVGPYDNSMQVLETGLLGEHGITKIGVSGHPEGSPDISDQDLASALAEKNRWAEESGADVYIETQFCFDADAILKWERRLRADGNRLPIHIGVPGLATIKTLLRYAQMSGIGPSMRVLTRQARNLTKLLMVQAPDKLIGDLAQAMDADPDCLITKMHFYPFGGLAKTAGWINAILANEFQITSKGALTVGEAPPLRAAS